jgi:hypothetical protein
LDWTDNDGIETSFSDSFNKLCCLVLAFTTERDSFSSTGKNVLEIGSGVCVP